MKYVLSVSSCLCLKCILMCHQLNMFITNETPRVPSVQVSNYPSVPQTVHHTEGSGAHQSATMPGPTVV